MSTTSKSWSRNAFQDQLLSLLPHQSSSRMTPTYPSTQTQNLSPSMKRQQSTNQFTACHSSTCIGQASPQVSLPSWPWLSSCSSSRGAVTSGVGDSDNHGPAMRRYSATSCPAPATIPARPSRSNQGLSGSLLWRSQPCRPFCVRHPRPRFHLPLVVPLHLPPSNFPPLPPPAGSLVAPPSTAISLSPAPAPAPACFRPFALRRPRCQVAPESN